MSIDHWGTIYMHSSLYCYWESCCLRAPTAETRPYRCHIWWVNKKTSIRWQDSVPPISTRVQTNEMPFLNFLLVGRPFVKQFALCYQTVRCLSVCDVGALSPNGWMDQDETWHVGRPRPWPHCVGWGPSTPPPKEHRSHQFSAHICCGQMAAWIKMPLGMEVGLSPGDLC